MRIARKVAQTTRRKRVLFGMPFGRNDGPFVIAGQSERTPVPARGRIDLSTSPGAAWRDRHAQELGFRLGRENIAAERSQIHYSATTIPTFMYCFQGLA